MTTWPEEMSDDELLAIGNPPVLGDEQNAYSTAESMAEEHDAWFRDVADLSQVADRDRRIAQAERDASDAYDADDRKRMWEHVATRERAFWAMPTLEDERGLPESRQDTVADDDADGW